MTRLQVQLDQDQYERLRALAGERSQSIAQLVREGVDRVLGDADRRRRWDDLSKAVGLFRDVEGRRDVSVSHDDIMAGVHLR